MRLLGKKKQTYANTIRKQKKTKQKDDKFRLTLSISSIEKKNKINSVILSYLTRMRGKNAFERFQVDSDLDITYTLFFTISEGNRLYTHCIAAVVVF